MERYSVKKMIALLSFMICLTSANINAKSINYYENKSRFTIEGETFSIEDEDGYSYRITNVRNKNNYEWAKRDDYESMRGVSADVDSELLYKAIAGSFTFDEIMDMSKTKEYFAIYFTVKPSGRVAAVSFSLKKRPKQMAISPYKIYLMDKHIKEYVTFKIIRNENKERNLYFLRLFQFKELVDFG